MLWLQSPSGNTPLHRIDARAKLLFIVAVSVLSLVLGSFTSLLFLSALTVVALALARELGRAKTFMVLLLAFSALSVAVVSLLRVGSALEFAKFFARVYAVMCSGLLLALTTSPSHLSKALEKLRVPRSVTFTLTLTIRFIPVFVKEAREVLDALKVRGVEAGLKGFIKNPGTLLRSLTVPMIIRMAKVADDLASALESRGFGSPARRTSLHEARFRGSDAAFLAATTVPLILLLIFDSPLFSLLDISLFWRFLV